MANELIRREANANGVKLWQIGERLNMQDSNFSRKLRHELPEAERERVLSIIREIAAEGGAKE